MKKKIVFGLLIIIGFVITGCKNSNIKINSFSQFERYEKAIICDEINDIVDISDDLDAFITSDGKVYILNFEQKFSNDKNCKLVNSETKMNRFLKEYMIDEDGNLYYSPSSYSTHVESRKTNSSDEKYYRYPNKYIYGLKKYGYMNIYDKEKNEFKSGFSDYFLEVFDENGTYSSGNKYFSLKDGEEIDYIIDKTIKTNLAIYVYDEKETNKEECEKYADVECKSSKDFFENPDFIYGGNDSLINSELSNIKFYKVISHIDSYTSVKNYTFAVTVDGKIYTNYE